ncbi:MAG: hypothetical protein H6677_10775 [Candidatus Obscuribacterales bacterium]|nr:hypothetical protein [Candidatus Obscuribacterales bacterium]
MYHYFKSSAIYSLVVLVAGLILTAPCLAEPSRLTTAQDCQKQDLAFVSKTFSNIPPRKELKKSPTAVELYEFDESPRGNRSPFLMVHGLRGEHYPYFRWQKVANHLAADKKFNSNFKIYFARYPTGKRMEETVPLFRKAVDRLYNACNRRQISVMALSIGGNLVYESLTDEETADKVRVLMTLGTPFHGSPLFSMDWMQYSVYKRLAWPLSRIDHSLSLRLYFSRNENLLADFGWDDYDRAIPTIGKFRSRLPLGPKGNLVQDTVTNERLRAIHEENPHLKKKIIAYSGYLKNPYLESKTARFIESTAMYPVTLFWVKFPAHLAREHPVLRVLNRDIASIDVCKSKKENIKSPYLYALNDGITPVSSALFLSAPSQKGDQKYKLESFLTDEKQIAELRPLVDVKLGRVFSNIDHLTFIDDFRPLSISEKVKDALAPNEPGKGIFDWILSDVISTANLSPHIAEDKSVKGEIQESKN